jgi:hypothetical protein
MPQMNLDTSDHLVSIRESLGGAKDQQTRVSLAASLKRVEQQVNAVRPKGGATAALAIDQQIEVLMGLDIYTGDVDADKVLKLAEEADRLAPSSGTKGVLAAAHLFHAAKDLRRANPAFDAYCKKFDRSVGVIFLLPAVASEPGPFQQDVLKDAHVRRFVDLSRDEASRFPDHPTPYLWAMMKNVDAAEAEKAAQIIRAAQRKQLDQSISSLLHPTSATQAMETYWLMQILGKPQEAKVAIQKVAALGIPIPIQP